MIHVIGGNIQGVTGTTLNVGFPLGAAPGDLAIISAVNAGGSAEIDTPDGWNVETDLTIIGGLNGIIFSKIMTAGDIATGNVTILFNVSHIMFTVTIVRAPSGNSGWVG